MDERAGPPCLSLGDCRVCLLEMQGAACKAESERKLALCTELREQAAAKAAVKAAGLKRQRALQLQGRQGGRRAQLRGRRSQERRDCRQRQRQQLLRLRQLALHHRLERKFAENVSRKRPGLATAGSVSRAAASSKRKAKSAAQGTPCFRGGVDPPPRPPSRVLVQKGLVVLPLACRT